MSGLTPQLVRERVRGTILERIGDTPLVPLHRIGAGLRGELWAKIESVNPGGSVKDRPGLWMVLAAEGDGRLRRGRTVLDATSGNTGVALAMVCAVRGHVLELCMPDKVSIERKRIIRAFGAKLVLTDPLEGADGDPSRDLERTRRGRASGHGDRRGDRDGEAARARRGDL